MNFDPSWLNSGLLTLLAVDRWVHWRLERVRKDGAEDEWLKDKVERLQKEQSEDTHSLRQEIDRLHKKASAFGSAQNSKTLRFTSRLVRLETLINVRPNSRFEDELPEDN